MTFGEKFRKYLAEKNMSISEFSRRVEGASLNTMTHWYNDAMLPRLDQIGGFPAETGMPLAYWCDDSVEDPANLGGDSALTEAERAVIKKARQLGLEQAGHILNTAIVVGYEKMVARLFGGLPAPDLGAERGQHPVRLGGGKVADHVPDPDHILPKHNPRKRGQE